MSISFGGEYDVRIRVKKEDLPKLRDVVKKVREGYVWKPGHWDRTRVHDKLSKSIIEDVEKAMEQDEDYAVIEIFQYIDDATHGFFGEYLNPMQEVAPRMEIAVKARFNSYIEGYAYKRAGDKPLVFGDTKYGDLDFGYTLTNDRDIFPKDAEWIPWARKTTLRNTV